MMDLDTDKMIASARDLVFAGRRLSRAAVLAVAFLLDIADRVEAEVDRAAERNRRPTESIFAPIAPLIRKTAADLDGAVQKVGIEIEFRAGAVWAAVPDAADELLDLENVPDTVSLKALAAVDPTRYRYAEERARAEALRAKAQEWAITLPETLVRFDEILSAVEALETRAARFDPEDAASRETYSPPCSASSRRSEPGVSSAHRQGGHHRCFDLKTRSCDIGGTTAGEGDLDAHR